MQVIETTQLESTYSDYRALFFTEAGLIVDSQTSILLIPFEKTVEQLSLAVKAVYLHDSTLVVKCESALTPDQMLETGFDVRNEKDVLASMEEEWLRPLILRALQWLAWDDKVQYCSKCTARLQKVLETTEKKCILCELSFFPKFSPAVMVLIQRENEILLARSTHFKSGFYSALAGFVEIGETAELAVHREVKEEVGLDISDLEYFGTQSWPFPDSFMIAFKAKYLRGEINIDVNEIEDARWFNINDLPELPPYASISRRLIDSVILKP